MNHYEVLGVPRDAPAEAIRKAYLRLARERHPDRFPEPAAKAEAERFFASLSEAYNTLSGEASRRDYDALLDRPVLPPKEQARQAWREASARLQAGDAAGAVEGLRAAIHLAPGVADYHAALGRALRRLPDAGARDVVQAFEEACRLDPRNPAYALELAALLASQGLKVRARRFAELAARLDPNDRRVVALLKELAS